MAQTACANILRDLLREPRKNFKYADKGSMATIGRNRAIAEIGNWKFSGYFAWLMWLFVHVISLIGFRNRLSVLTEWMWAYFTRERSARLIVGDAEAMSDSRQLLEAKAATQIPTLESQKNVVKTA
jgi:NADH dehydrogenase